MYLTEGYRVREWGAPKNVSAGDVVRYEQEILKNKLGIGVEVLAILDTLPSGALRWVTQTRKAARRYGGYIEHIPFEPAALILADDNEEGFLVLTGAQRLLGTIADLQGLQKEECQY